ncbi:MAG TPA: hypothetical protein VFB61_04325 [Gemmatimonadales bacterium]|nr:hypothetical protein [Gemmatimonadales bacterium]
MLSNRLFISSLVALGLLLGCDHISPVSQSAASSQDDIPIATAAGARPWKESYHSTGTITADPRCPSPLLLESYQGGGTATHTGKYDIVNSHCLDPATGALTNGTFLKTVANGDQLFGSYSGNSSVIQPPSPVGIFRVNGTLTFTGGTGRFTGATGTTTMSGTEQADFSQTPVATQVELTMVGEISY